MVCRLIVRLPSSEICQWRVDEVNTILQCLENTKPASNCSFRNQYPVVTASEQIRTLQRVNRVRDGVQVMVLLAFSCLPIVCYANPQSAFYPWPVIERYDRNCSYLYTLAYTTQLTKSADLTDGSSSLWNLVNIEWIYSLKTYIFCTKRCLATVSNNSATTPFSLLVIRNGRQEVHARTLTSVCKSGIHFYGRDYFANFLRLKVLNF